MHRLFGDGNNPPFALFIYGPLQPAHTFMRLFKGLTKKGGLTLLLDEKDTGVVLMLVL